jgi:phosphinothricin acetyltransferase
LTRIYNHYITETAITFDIEPFTPEQRRPWLEKFSPEGRHRCFVAEIDGVVAGWACSDAFRPKAAYDSTVELSVYLDPGATGRGLGRSLYETLLASLAGTDLHLALGGVTLPNDASVALHEHFGFASTGVLREVGWKFDRYWDVEWFAKKLPPSGS